MAYRRSEQAISALAPGSSGWLAQDAGIESAGTGRYFCSTDAAMFPDRFEWMDAYDLIRQCDWILAQFLAGDTGLLLKDGQQHELR